MATFNKHLLFRTWHVIFYNSHGTVIQIENARINDRLYVSKGPFLNLGIGTSALELELEMELELELILQTPLFSFHKVLWTPNLAGWSLRMRGPHPQSNVTLRYRGHVTSKKTLYLHFHKACGLRALQGSDLV